jgi:phosphohistidine phosphatase
MRRLLLLRHAKTERPEPGQRDRDRKLMERGRLDAPVIGAFMARHGLVPDLALVSPATRTLETWQLTAVAFAQSPRMVTDERIYNAAADTILEVIRETSDAGTVLVVGHNPSLHDVARQLTGSGDVETREDLNDRLPTSGLVVIDFAFDAWPELHDHAGRLELFVTPRLIDAASD